MKNPPSGAGPTNPVSPRRERGFALLVVLWSVTLITLLTTQIIASGHTALLLAGAAANAAAARARADGATSEALFHLLSTGADYWPADGTAHQLNADCDVQIWPLDNEINPNTASTSLLIGLLEASGTTVAQAVRLANAIVQWRSLAISRRAEQIALIDYQHAGLSFGPPGHAFADPGELAYVLGMPPAVLANALPHLNVYQPSDPDPRRADPLVRQALALSGLHGSDSRIYRGPYPVVSIEVSVRGPDHSVLRRNAIVSVNGAQAQPAFKILSLTDGD